MTRESSRAACPPGASIFFSTTRARDVMVRKYNTSAAKSIRKPRTTVLNAVHSVFLLNTTT